MLTIGQLAEAAGTTVRTVRHYHAEGLLPEPARRPNGYREYDAPALLRLVRVRRLVGLGLSLPEVRDALVGDDARELREVLAELVGDLARREADLREQRERLTALLASGTDLRLPAALGELVEQLRGVAAPPRLVAQEQELLELLQATLPDGQFAAIGEAYAAALADPERVARSVALAQRFAALAGADPGDEEVEAVAHGLAREGEAMAGVAGQDAGPAAQAAWTAYVATLGEAQRRCLALVERGLTG